MSDDGSTRNGPLAHGCFLPRLLHANFNHVELFLKIREQLHESSAQFILTHHGLLERLELLQHMILQGLEVLLDIAQAVFHIAHGSLQDTHITMATSETNPESGPLNPNMQRSGGTVYATPYVAPAHGSTGKDFKRWQQKMLFYLTTLNLARFLQEDAPDLGDNPDRKTVTAVDAWKHSDLLCKNYILNGLDNALYKVYSPMVNAKALWESLEKKYKTEDAGSKKFVVGKFLDFMMVDSKTVISQVQEFQLILHDIHAEGMVLGESFQVAALIEKLPPTWKDFKNYLKHKRKEMKLEDLIVKLRIEEDNRQSEKKVGNYHQEAKANVVEQGLHLNHFYDAFSPANSVASSEDHSFATATESFHSDAHSEDINASEANSSPVGSLAAPIDDEMDVYDEDVAANLPAAAIIPAASIVTELATNNAMERHCLMPLLPTDQKNTNILVGLSAFGRKILLGQRNQTQALLSFASGGSDEASSSLEPSPISAPGNAVMELGAPTTTSQQQAWVLPNTQRQSLLGATASTNAGNLRLPMNPQKFSGSENMASRLAKIRRDLTLEIYSPSQVKIASCDSTLPMQESSPNMSSQNILDAEVIIPTTGTRFVAPDYDSEEHLGTYYIFFIGGSNKPVEFRQGPCAD
ncbi:hypothetical protein RJ639_020236 [Escallonia herrerae]|uniref:Uncharacterized protein n=1 Tax=Escallonia herrerae TaxID=1293975 RepID=A0AA88VBH5_9ASTE|nr:hypothetical protein RJ639_020236 [Escallonia herrerae]